MVLDNKKKNMNSVNTGKTKINKIGVHLGTNNMKVYVKKKQHIFQVKVKYRENNISNS